MRNKITASIRFCFKGQTHEPMLELDIDEFMRTSQKIEGLYRLLAREGNFDLYSYEYEMMQAEPIRIKNASGLITQYINDEILDINAFAAAWKTSQINKKLSTIAQTRLNIDDLTQQPDLQAALFDAYTLGQENK